MLPENTGALVSAPGKIWPDKVIHSFVAKTVQENETHANYQQVDQLCNRAGLPGCLWTAHPCAGPNQDTLTSGYAGRKQGENAHPDTCHPTARKLATLH